MTPIDMPRIDDAGSFAPFTAGLAERRLLLQRCTTCSTVQLGRIRCDACLGGTFDWIQSGERGHIHAYATMHRAYHPAFADRIPYTVGIVELAEGPRVVAALDLDRSRLRAGLPVRVTWSEQQRVALRFAEEKNI
jgi:uncharacterized OB-fold protein